MIDPCDCGGPLVPLSELEYDEDRGLYDKYRQRFICDCCHKVFVATYRLVQTNMQEE